MFIVGAQSDLKNSSGGAKYFVGHGCYISLVRSWRRSFNTGSINIASLRDWIMIGSVALLCVAPTMAQRKTARQANIATHTAGDGITSCANNFLEAVVEALLSNALAQVETQVWHI